MQRNVPYPAGQRNRRFRYLGLGRAAGFTPAVFETHTQTDGRDKPGRSQEDGVNPAASPHRDSPLSLSFTVWIGCFASAALR